MSKTVSNNKYDVGDGSGSLPLHSTDKYRGSLDFRSVSSLYLGHKDKSEWINVLYEEGGALSVCFSEVMSLYSPEKVYDDTDSKEIEDSCSKGGYALFQKEESFFDLVFGSPREDLWDNVKTGGILVSPIVYLDKNMSQYTAGHSFSGSMDSEYHGIISSSLMKVKKGKIKHSNTYSLLIWKKTEPLEISPPLRTIKVSHNQMQFTVIQEGVMVGGSKQRMYKGFSNIKEREIVYAGPNTGMAQVALSIIGKYWGKDVTIFTNSTPGGSYTRMTARAARYGAKIMLQADKTILGTVENKAKTYCRGKNQGKKDDAYCCPFGLDSKELREAWVEEVKSLIPPDMKPKRMWLATGSGTLVKMLNDVFPDTEFHAVQVGKKINPNLLGNKKLFIHPVSLRFEQPTNDLPPYDSVPEYDAKVWSIMMKEGKDGDYIWNVGY